MDSRFLLPRSSLSAPSGPKLRQINDAKEMQGLILDRAKRQGKEPPPYEFLELIGKGTYGRVYKSKSAKPETKGQVVAIKIIDVDTPDYREATWDSRDDTINNFTKEISALRRLKDSSAKNITLIHEAFTFDAQLWLVSEYCQGGSVSTLLKASPDRRLEEHFIIPIARELAVALKYIHDAGIVHRDIKCGNILIMEDGALRLADFGVAGIFESNVSKRTTIIGTPHWMPLELVKELGNENPNVTYGTEVDIWAYGCAVYEMATGHGPNQRVRPNDLADTLREGAPRLEDGDRYSQRLQDFVEFCLQINPKQRPTATQVLEYSYLTATTRRYPTDSLEKLVERFYAWEKKGGERKSLFINVGAALPENLAEEDPEEEDWYFSTTLAFEQRVEDEAHERLYNAINAEADASTPVPAKLTPRERRLKAEEGASADRGAKALGAIFDVSGSEYKYSDRPDILPIRTSDLPFRNMGSDRAADRTTMIDLDLADTLESVPSLLDVSTLRATRSNRFFADSDEEESDEENTYPRARRESNRKTKDWKMPLLSAPADPDFNRRTVDWKFPSTVVTDVDDEQAQNTTRKVGPDANGSNRDTMAWSFPKAAEQASATTRDSLSVPQPQGLRARPSLRQATTMPVGETQGFQVSNSPDRASMIDLDLEMPVAAADLSRPSTSASNISFADFAPDNERFNIDEQPEASNRAMTVNSNRTSLHRQSQSEPNARSSKGSELDAQVDVNSSWHGREQSATSEAYSSTNGAVKLFDPLNEKRARERRRIYANSGSTERAGSSSDSRPPNGATYQQAPGVGRIALSLRSQDSTLVGSSSQSSVRSRGSSLRDSEQDALDDAHRLLDEMMSLVQMTTTFYERSEIVGPTRSSVAAACQYWRKRGDDWVASVFRQFPSSELMDRR